MHFDDYRNDWHGRLVRPIHREEGGKVFRQAERRTSRYVCTAEEVAFPEFLLRWRLLRGVARNVCQFHGETYSKQLLVLRGGGHSWSIARHLQRCHFLSAQEASFEINAQREAILVEDQHCLHEKIFGNGAAGRERKETQQR